MSASNSWSKFQRAPNPATLTESELTHSAAAKEIAAITASYDFSQFCLTSFCHWIEQRRQRQIVVVGWSMPLHVYGAWVSYGAHDFVFFDKHTIPLHQAHIQLHELAHILLGHETLDISHEQGLTFNEVLHFVSTLIDSCPAYSPAFDEILQRSVAQRTTSQEQEAESLCELIQQTVQGYRLSERLSKPISFSRNQFVLEAYRSMDWL